MTETTCTRCGGNTLSCDGGRFCMKCQLLYTTEGKGLKSSYRTKQEGLQEVGRSDATCHGEATYDAGTTSVTFSLPYPLSVNHLYPTVNGRRIKSEEGKQYMEQAGTIARRYVSQPITGPVAVQILYCPKNQAGLDLDNVCKVVLDALTGVCWHDDRQINRLSIERGEVVKGGDLTITIGGVEA
jgi:Holliday junction resolvase